MATLIKGQELQLMVAGKPIAFCTNHVFTLNSDTTDTSSKDNGDFGSTQINKISWTISSDSLYCSYAAGVNNYDVLVDVMLAKQPIDVVFCRPANYTSAGLVRGGNTANDAPEEWTQNTTYLTGKAVLTSLTLNAQNGETANYSAEFTGNGALNKVGSYLV